jgi:hypothetical protein
MLVHQFGPPRSGTNYLARLVELNFPQVELRDEGKHGPVLADEADAYLLAVKEPWAWIQSFASFMRHPEWDRPRELWYGLKGRSLEPLEAKRYLLVYLNELVGWRRWLPEPVAIVQYRDLLTDLETVLAGLGDELDVEEPDRGFRDVGDRLDSGGEPQDSSFDPSFYVDRRYLDEYHEDEIEAILGFTQDSWREQAFAEIGMNLAELLDDPSWRGFPDRPKIRP